jgi:hypothetical protein
LLIKGPHCRIIVEKYLTENSRSIAYLGHIVSREGVELGPQKIQTITKWYIPKNINILRRFWGLKGYYQKFFNKYACNTCPFTSLLKKKWFVWNEYATFSFSLLNNATYSTPILATLNFGKISMVKLMHQDNELEQY